MAATPDGVRLGPSDSFAPSCSSYFQGTQRQMLRCILRAWHLKVWGPGNVSGNARITLAPEPLGGILGEEASLGCSAPHSSLGKVRGRGWMGQGR